MIHAKRLVADAKNPRVRLNDYDSNCGPSVSARRRPPAHAAWASVRNAYIEGLHCRKETSLPPGQRPLYVKALWPQNHPKSLSYNRLASRQPLAAAVGVSTGDFTLTNCVPKAPKKAGMANLLA